MVLLRNGKLRSTCAWDLRRLNRTRVAKVGKRLEETRRPVGIHIDEKSMWSDVKKAFRKAAMSNNFNFDRSNKTEAEIKTAEVGFMEAQAAYAMLEDIYRTEGRLD